MTRTDEYLSRGGTIRREPGRLSAVKGITAAPSGSMRCSRGMRRDDDMDTICQGGLSGSQALPAAAVALTVSFPNRLAPA